MLLEAGNDCYCMKGRGVTGGGKLMLLYERKGYYWRWKIDVTAARGSGQATVFYLWELLAPRFAFSMTSDVMVVMISFDPWSPVDKKIRKRSF